MSERDTQIDRDVDVGLDDTVESRDTSLGEPTGGTTDTSRERTSDEGDSWLRSTVGSVVSSRSVLIGLVLAIAGAVLFGAIPFIGLLGNLLGVAAAGFVYGLGSSARRYFEMALAGALAGGGIALLGNVVLAVFVTGGTLVAVGAAGGAVAGALGHYFGRDLRDGLTRDLGEPP